MENEEKCPVCRLILNEPMEDYDICPRCGYEKVTNDCWSPEYLRHCWEDRGCPVLIPEWVEGEREISKERQEEWCRQRASK